MKTKHTIWTITEEQLTDKDVRKHAGGKAREDISKILAKCGIAEKVLLCPQIERKNAWPLKKIMFHIKVKKIWSEIIKELSEGDVLIIQFPLVNHTLLFKQVVKELKNKQIRIIAIVHDLEVLRRSKEKSYSLAAKIRMKREEIDVLHEFDGIVVHNEKMKNYVIETFGLSAQKVETINIFDYLIDEKFVPKNNTDDYKSCIIAGNLSRMKSEYVYRLPKAPRFELYGINYDIEEYPDNIRYHGSFLADDLPLHLIGGFGLVWDGESPETCIGAWGEYLKYNNPHKTSLYLACGIPVIIWEEAALADYISSHNVGRTVKSLFDIEGLLNNITQEEYIAMKNNVVALSEKLRNGDNTKEALRALNVL